MADADFFKTYALPRNLHKYRDGSPRSLDALEKGVLFFASYDSMNDPMEGFSEQSRTAIEKFGSREAEIMQRTRALGLCCLSEDKAVDLMWAHYAANFSGFCLSLNLTRLKNALAGRVEAIKVSYVREFPVIFSKDLSDLDAAARKTLSYKKDSWAYEKEWRLIAPKPGPISIDEALSGIHVGPRASKDLVARLSAIATDKKIEIRRMTVEGYHLASAPL